MVCVEVRENTTVSGVPNGKTTRSSRTYLFKRSDVLLAVGFQGNDHYVTFRTAGKIFRARGAKMSRKLFGTDGIRGRTNSYPIDAETILKIGIAVGSVIGKTLKKPKQLNLTLINLKI